MFFNPSPLISQFNQFSQIQSLHQKEMIAWLRTISQQLAEINQQIKQNQNYAHN